MSVKPVFLRSLFCALACVALLFTPVAATPEPATPALDLAGLDTFLQAQVQANHIPGLSVAVVRDGQVIMLRGYGQASPGQPMTPSTQLYLGSVSKSFTALAVMQLVEQGKLELDAPVQRYLPWWQVDDPAASAQITVRHLLNHTSGLSEEGDPDPNFRALTLVEQARAMRNVRQTAPTGTKFQYYNQNYRLLGLLIEQVTGQTYADYMREHVFGPLGMPQTVTDPAAAPQMAQGYGQVFGFPIPRQQIYRAGIVPSGEIVSSAEDMAHYMIALLDEGRAGDKQLVQPATLAQMWTAPSGVTGGTYGAGWLIDQDKDAGPVIVHGGALENFGALVLMLPAQRIGIAYLSNQGGLLPQLVTYESLTSGVAKFLSDEPIQVNSLRWIHLVSAVIAAAVLAISLFWFYRLPRWARNPGRRRPFSRWLATIVGLVVSLALLAGFPTLLAAAFGGKGGWKDVYDLLPDVAMWLILVLALSTVREVIKIVILLRSRPAGMHADFSS